MAVSTDRAGSGEVRPPPAPEGGPPVVLLAVANDRVPGGRRLRNLAEERRAIQRQLEGAVALEVLPDALLSEVWDAFDDPRLRGRIRVFHFAGHASGSWLSFEDEAGAPVNAGAEGLAGFLGRQDGLVLVFLNGCSTLAQVERLRERVPAVIATSDAIDDAAAAKFAGRVYAALRTKPLEQAFADAADFMKAKAGGNPRGVTRELELDDEHEEERSQWPWLLDCDDAHRSWRLLPPSRQPAAGRWRSWAAVAGGLVTAGLGGGWWLASSTEADPAEETGSKQVDPPGPQIEMTFIPEGRVCADVDDPSSCSQVEVAPFCLAVTEMTQGQWEALHGYNPSWVLAGIGEDLPVDNITWEQALEAANRLSRREQRSVCYRQTDAGWSTVDPPCDGYRLPTDLEWERLSQELDSSDCAYANIADRDLFSDAWEVVEHYERSPEPPIALSPADCVDGYARLAPVGSLQRGPYGLADLQGNVAEWVWSDATAHGADVRGRSFAWPGDDQNVLARFRQRGQDPKWRDGAVGLRLARDLPPSGDCGSR